MARETGLLPISANFEPATAQAFDARMRTGLKSDLTNAGTFGAFAYLGMLVVVYDDTSANNGLYVLKALPVTTESNWEKIGDEVSWDNITGSQSDINLSGFTNDSGFITGVSWSEISGTQSDINLSGFTDDLTTYVPYTGATGNVDLGANDLYVHDVVASNDVSIDYNGSLKLISGGGFGDYSHLKVDGSKHLEILNNYEDADIYFRVNNGALKTAMYIDSSFERIGVWNSSPTYDFDITGILRATSTIYANTDVRVNDFISVGEYASTDDMINTVDASKGLTVGVYDDVNDPVIKVRRARNVPNTPGDVRDSDVFGKFLFEPFIDRGNSFQPVAYMQAEADGTFKPRESYPTKLSFWTTLRDKVVPEEVGFFDSKGDFLTVGSATISGTLILPSVSAGTDNTVLILDGTTVKTDEIDSRVWGSSLVDKTGTPVNNQLAVWTDSNTLEGDSGLTYDGSTLDINGTVTASGGDSTNWNTAYSWGNHSGLYLKLDQTTPQTITNGTPSFNNGLHILNETVGIPPAGLRLEYDDSLGGDGGRITSTGNLTLRPTNKTIIDSELEVCDKIVFDKGMQSQTGLIVSMSDIVSATATDSTHVVISGDLSSDISVNDVLWMFAPADADNELLPTVKSVSYTAGTNETTIEFKEELAYWLDAQYDAYDLRYPTGTENDSAFAFGKYSIASGNNSFALSLNSIASNTHTFAFGSLAKATGTGCMSLGTGCEAGGNEALAGGAYSSTHECQAFAFGSNCKAEEAVSSAIGGSAYARKKGEHCEASIQFSEQGDCQHSRMMLQVETEDATPTVCEQINRRYTIPEDTILACTITINGTNSDGSVSGMYIRQLIIKNIGGTTSLTGSVQTIGTDIETGSIGGISITANNTNNSLDITVTGKASTTIRWGALVSAVMIGWYDE